MPLSSSTANQATCIDAHPDELHKRVVDAGAVGLEEAGAGRELVEEEELLLSAHQPVVPLLRLLYPRLVLCTAPSA